jgi:2',3'-cyclic-nucleotide 2'-phosphodiesterase (5'-nucleotidase family)
MKLFILAIIFSSTIAIGSTDLQRLTIFFTNDLHGGITRIKAEFLNPEFPPILGGGASSATLIKKIQKQAEQENFGALIIDSGDIFQGTLVGTLSEGQAIVEFMNLIGYDAVVPGNHDFDLGRDNLIELIKESNFPWVSCNIYNKETGKHWEWVKPYVIKNIANIKIGITGATTRGTEYMSFPEHIAGLEFRSEIENLQKTVDELRKQKVDLVVVMVHTGLPYDPKEGYEKLQQTTYESVKNSGYANAMEIAHYVQGIDVLLGGHIHKGYDIPWEDPKNHTICIQNYGNGGNLGWLNLYLDNRTKSIVSYDYPADDGTLLLLQEDEFWPDSTVQSFIQSKKEKYEKGFEDIIGETRIALSRSSIGESPMNNLITDAMRERVNADFAFTNLGGIRSDLKVGSITRENIFKVLPFGNQIVTFKVDGNFLKNIIERKVGGSSRGLAIAGGKVVFNKTLPDGERIVNIKINDTPIDPDQIYRLATTDYLMEGNSGLYMLKEIPFENVAYTGILLREAVIEYIHENTPIEPKTDGRWKRDDNASPLPEWVQKFGEPQASK